MGAKVDAALRAIDGGVQAVIIAAGGEHEVIDKIIRGEPAGTAFFHVDNFVEAVVSSAPCDSKKLDSATNNTILSRNTSFTDAADVKTVEFTQTTLSVEEIAINARKGSRELNQVSEDLRMKILLDIANNIKLRENEILAANVLDLDAAEKRYVICIY